jgi:hypothetical protein
MFSYCNLNDVKMWLAGLDISEMPSTLDAIIESTYIPWAKKQVDIFIGENLDYTTTTEYYNGTGSNVLSLRHRPVHYLRECILHVIPSLQWYTFQRWFHIDYLNQFGVQVGEPGGVEPIGTAQPIDYRFAAGSPVPADLISATPTATFTNSEAQYGRSDLFVNCRLGQLSILPRILYLKNQAIPFWNYTWLTGYSNIKISYDYGYTDLDNVPADLRSACAQFVAAAVLINKGQFAGAGTTALTLERMPKSFGEMPYSGHIKSYLESAKLALNAYKRITC